MKRLCVILVFLSLFLMPAGAETGPDDGRHLSVEAGLMVFDRRVAADALGEWAEQNGGYFTWKSDDSVRIRVPDAAVEELRSFLEELGDGILHYGRSAVDLREEMMRARSALEAREEILGRNMELLDSSDVEGTLELEQEIRRLMAEIDASRGYLNKLEHDVRMALVNVSLSFRSQTVPVSRPSKFDWINGVDFYAFLEGYEMPGSRVPKKPLINVPAGFAETGGEGGMDALSPEGVRLRVRRVRNYPEQSSEFWEAALENDLTERGYISVEENLEAGWNEGFTLSLWALPVGNEDYLYLIGIRIDGNRIELLEAAGKAEYMMTRMR